jgi:hypothetical protein
LDHLCEKVTKAPGSTSKGRKAGPEKLAVQASEFPASKKKYIISYFFLPSLSTTNRRPRKSTGGDTSKLLLRSATSYQSTNGMQQLSFEDTKKIFRG